MSKMTNNDWMARKVAAKTLLEGQQAKHQAAYDQAMNDCVYMYGCPPRDDTHPAIQVAESAHLNDRMQSALHHKALLAHYTAALREVSDMEPTA